MTWFGGKSRVADIVWQRFGDVKNYVEPFYGSGAVHLLRPSGHKHNLETINDYDGYVANFWRAIQAEPETVAGYADNPVNENDLHARHIWLVNQRETLRARLDGSPDHYDAKIAGWWVWGICCWIGSGFCSGNGPWQSVDELLVNTRNGSDGINRQLVHLGDKGQGINRQLAHLGNKGRGINRQRVHLGGAYSGGQGVHSGKAMSGGLYDWFNELSARLRYVRVCSGDWSRVTGPSVTFKHGLTGVFLDPPYGEEATRSDLYRIDSHTIAHDVRQWCIDNGDNPLFRIALCGYDGEHNALEDMGWAVEAWKAHGGYGSQGNTRGRENSTRERIWFSPACLGKLAHLPLFSMAAGDNS